MRDWTANDWTALGTGLSGVGSILGAVAVMVAAWIASNTFEGWRKQKLSERRIEQAERILTAAYNARRALGYVRSSGIMTYETAEAEAYLETQDIWSNSDKDKKKKLINGQIYYKRLNNVADERRAVDECLPMARALFGEKVETALELLNRQFYLVQTAADASTWDGNDREFQMSISQDLSGFSTTTRPNKMNELIDTQVKVIEDGCMPLLRLEAKRSCS